ncbi:MAG: hypothetical protein PVG39_01230 [Desulfobacteraceae bacterium]|jgi:hypothetical protein
MKKKMITASYLFDSSNYYHGQNKCYYCGLPCGNHYLKQDYVKETFTNRDIVKNPGSNFVCGCCISSFAGLGKTEQIDGTVKEGRGGAPRCYSWILTLDWKKAFTKRHLDFCRTILFDPPKPPFSIILADSGQKHLIFRAPVNYDRDMYSVLLEEKEIIVDRVQLRRILDCALIASAAIGKKSLTNPDQFINWKNTVEFYGSESPLEEWCNIFSSPLGELAAWICPGKEECRNESIVSTRIQTEVSGIDRPLEKTSGDGRKGGKRRGHKDVFNLTGIVL